MNAPTPHVQKGFTLIELIVVIVVLGIVSISMSGIVRNAMETVITVSSRENLIREGGFLVERFNRELSNAVPNSARIRGNAVVHCIEFVPMKWNAHYLSLPEAGQSSNIANLVELSDINGASFTPSINDYAIVYPTRPAQVYVLGEGHRTAVKSCTDDGDGDCSTLDDSDQVIQLEVNERFAQTSPSQRMYFAQSIVSYCMRDQAIYRYTRGFNDNSLVSDEQPLYTSGGSLMAQNVVNQLGINTTSGEQNPFRSIGASSVRNGFTQTLFIFGREDERVTFMQEVQIPNVP